MSPRDWTSRGLGPTSVQSVHFFPIADEQYVAESAWERAVLDECPFHPEGGCGVVGHGSYPRVHPPGMRVARFWCSVAGRSISLLPAFLAARLPSTLAEVEAVVDAVEAAPSLAAAADVARPPDAENAVTSISAARWVRRRVRPVCAALVALVTLLPELAGCAPTLAAVRARLGKGRVLVTLRDLGRSHISAIGPPLGFSGRGGR
jgi:hypothetical protein